MSDFCSTLVGNEPPNLSCFSSKLQHSFSAQQSHKGTQLEARRPQFCSLRIKVSQGGSARLAHDGGFNNHSLKDKFFKAYGYNKTILEL